MLTTRSQATSRPRVVVIDDDAGVVDDLVETLGEHDFDVTGTTSPEEALELIASKTIDLVLADVVMPTMRGDELLRRAHEVVPDQLVILMTAFGSIEQGVAAIRAGACDFIAKPFPPETLVPAVERALRERQLMREIVRLRKDPEAIQTEIVARSDAMSKVVDVARRAAQSQVTVLITGESGVGKGLVARAIHQWSARAAAPFVNLNCAALPAALAEAELFGARKGAYTDAKVERDGLFVKASGGSLFLDEIAELPLELQPKLLRALEDGYVRPVGGVEEVQISTRLIAATNASLEEAVADGAFRADLYHRLNVVRITFPPPNIGTVWSSTASLSGSVSRSGSSMRTISALSRSRLANALAICRARSEINPVSAPNTRAAWHDLSGFSANFAAPAARMATTEHTYRSAHAISRDL